VAASPLDQQLRAIVARYVARFRRVADAEVRRRVPAAVREEMRP
jgi:hypothetical protein